ncbi:hypothetical protein ACFXKS_10885 [Streptomyces scopuliridis]|uniref:hypothetical protein n=1 Tax=Streptomyces scopuliridis TaxID=452529 RepID=UPI0036C4ADC2
MRLPPAEGRAAAPARRPPARRPSAPWPSARQPSAPRISTRWLTPYARSRQVPASLAAALIATVAARSLTRGTESGEP